ncbi:MAG: NAD(P)/FAD-dependent oxidoreductase [candidate division KSB1 bacterium]|nr:NAD(P)/FAD-dependent oxidoreductase [candidate division KSB1 bacterium]MDZ7295265.1 NAD(P)/FAD-dependent oxidoreductase [candidate division KSB1 bacterium]MDZ7338882.1 NAD(P)/FAD-dependent oxidoreductase [candidate division KSB1 bacterium]MDZ7378652.1 NAD(P)/FAD-dependent oxidoreductase [candidate division KSB1 bacterium]MDZ7385150.1 NAD(P)/FAD-dependent oxidoreductase [candidate division KSB1 bacterium]
MKSRYDVVVVGAGPAGSTAARFAALGGASVLLLEKDREVGIPVRCAEGVGQKGLAQVVEAQERWIDRVIRGAFLYAPNGMRVCLETSDLGYILNRKLFDYDLARLAAEAGAEVLTKANVTGLILRDGVVHGVQLMHLGRAYTVQCSIVIGADGVESRVGRWAGLRTHVSLHDIESCAQVTASNVEIEDTHCHFYFGREVAPGGYAWVFPKGNGVANIGLGVSGDCARTKPAWVYLEQFLAARFPRVSVLTTVAGGVPVARPLKRMVSHGLMLVGDAARQANPVSGGGIVSGMIAAKIAGEVAAQAIKESDVSQQRLQEYADRWHDQEGKAHERFYRLKEAIWRLTDEDLNRTAEAYLRTAPEKRSLLNLFATALVNQPKLIVEAAKVFV